MLKQMKYFLSVVRLGSFTAAAEEHYISQSAMSQQIKALEADLGVSLLERGRRSFSLTKAGEFFYKKSLILINDCDTLVRETKRIAGDNDKVLRVGVLKGYSGSELKEAVAAFTAQLPDVTIEVTHGNHDALYDLLRSGELDIVLNDQRRAFSDEYRNIVLDIREYYAEVAASSPLAELNEADIADLKNTSLILLSSEDQQQTERSFYINDLGFKSEIIFCEHLDDAHMLVIQGKGFMPIEGSSDATQTGARAVRLTRGGSPILRRYCAFTKADADSEYIEIFTELLRQQF